MGRKFLPTFLFAAFIAMIIIAFGQGTWITLLMINLRYVPNIPWFIFIEAVILLLCWLYAGGRGWPARTKIIRLRYRRANPVPRDIFMYTLLAGFLAITGVVGWWIVLYRLIPTHPNALPDLSGYPLYMAVSALVTASFVSPVFEEIACRGYCQTMLEGVTRPSNAILLSSLIFTLAHLTQGAEVSKLIVYFLVGLTFGTMAFIADSILPGLIVHAIGDASFFLLVWPLDATRTPVTTAGTDISFWIHLVQAILFSFSSILVFFYVVKKRHLIPVRED